MDDSSPVMSLSVPDGAARENPASQWQPGRPVLVYDPAAQQPAGPHGGWRVGQFLCRTPVLWLCALTLGAVVGGTLALTNPLAYAATGLLLGFGTDQTAQDEAAIIRSNEVARGVVDRLGILRVAPQCMPEMARAAACAVGVVKAQMQVRVAGDPNGFESAPMLRLTATHADPAIAVAMLDAAVAVDRNLWHAAHLGDRPDALDPQLAAAQNALDETLTDMARIRAQAHVTNIAQDLVQATAETNAIARQDANLRLRQATVGAELKAAQTALQTTPETVLDSREVSSGDPGLDQRAMLLQLKLQRAHLVQLYAHDYPGVAELDHKIETVETAMKAQAKSTTSVTRDVRNPVLALFSTKIAALVAESAGLVQQRQELQRQSAAASAREASLRGAEQTLFALQQRQGPQEAVVRQLTLSAANLRAQDLLNTGRLAQRRLLQRPEAVVVPWTGKLAAGVAGTATGLIYGLVVSLIAWRRRSFRDVVQVSRQALERLEQVWMAPAPDMSPQVMSVALPQGFAAQRQPAAVQLAVSSDRESLTTALQTLSLPMFAFRRERDIKSLVFQGHASGLSAKAGG